MEEATHSICLTWAAPVISAANVTRAVVLAVDSYFHHQVATHIIIERAHGAAKAFIWSLFSSTTERSE